MNPVRVRSIAIVGLLILTTTITTGCDILLGLRPTDVPLPRTGDVPLLPTPSDDPDESTDPGDPFGPPEATYRSGTATLAIDGDEVTLGRLAAPATYFEEFGANLIWTGGDGWYLQVGAAKADVGPFGLPAYLAIDHVHDGQHWVSWDPDGCTITIIQADPAGVRGTASCKNMRWVDSIANGLAEEPTPVAGQPPFAAEITFVARP